jgi:hypothetical protein
MKVALVSLVVVMILCLHSCNDNSTKPTDNGNVNSPVITNLTNNFTYSVQARNYTATDENTLSFTSDSLIVTLTSSEYLSGIAIVSLRDSLDTVIFTDTIQSNETNVIVGLKTSKPESYRINTADLTAKLVFVVVGQ